VQIAPRIHSECHLTRLCLFYLLAQFLEFHQRAHLCIRHHSFRSQSLTQVFYFSDTVRS
jgi:hypothetical protein